MKAANARASHQEQRMAKPTLATGTEAALSKTAIQKWTDADPKAQSDIILAMNPSK